MGNGTLTVLGDLPGCGAIYGFRLSDHRGSLTAIVNAGQLHAQLPLTGEPVRILFRDAGYHPPLTATGITVGPEQLMLLGSGVYAAAEHDLGVQDDVIIPARSTALPLTVSASGRQAVMATVDMPTSGALRLILRQCGSDGVAKRSTGGAPPKGITLGKLLTISASRDGQPVALDINYDKAIWSGLSWAVAEIPATRVSAGPLMIEACSHEAQPVQLELTAFINDG